MDCHKRRRTSKIHHISPRSRGLGYNYANWIINAVKPNSVSCHIVSKYAWQSTDNLRHGIQYLQKLVLQIKRQLPRL